MLARATTILPEGRMEADTASLLGFVHGSWGRTARTTLLPRIHHTGVGSGGRISNAPDPIRHIPRKDPSVEDGMAAYSLMLHAGWVRAQMVDWRRRDGTSLEIDVSTPKLMSKPIDQPETDDNK